MTDKDKATSITFTLAIGAIFAAIVFIATITFTIPIPATSGYFNLGETAIYVVALLFGPLAGGLAGGVGAAMADAYVAPQFALGTLVIKTCEGIIVGFLAKAVMQTKRSHLGAIIAMALGGLEMILGYFLYEQLVLNYPLIDAAAEIPFNLVQMLVGVLVAFPIMNVVLRVFPQLKS